MKITGLETKTDEQLVQEYLKGNNSALGTLYNRYFQKVHNKCISFTKNTDDAFDLAQDILIKAFSNISSFKGNSKFTTWLFTITHNHCINIVLKSKKILFEELNYSNNLADNSSEPYELEERYQREEQELRINHLLNDISELDQRILMLKYYNNFSIKELQSEYQLSASAVKMRLLRARQKIEQIYYQTAI